MMDPLDPSMAMVDESDTTGNDPVASVDLAVEAGVASPERERTEPDPEVRAMVAHWWDRTSETADFESAIQRQVKDQVAIDGGSPQQIADAAEITVQHIYRNAIQSMALMVPEETGVRWKPREMAEVVPGMAEPPELSDWRRQAQGLANVVTVLDRRFAQECNQQEKIESFVQSAIHYRMAILKVWWQRDLAHDPISRDRLADEQDQLALLRVLIEQYDHGEFNKGDVQYQQMRQLMASQGLSEMDVRRGLVIEGVPIGQYRCDPSVIGPEHQSQAAWERHDILMRRQEILAKWDHISDDDLNSATTYSVDEQGRWLKRDMDDRTATTRESKPRDIGLRDTGKKSGEDWLLVAEIYDYQTNTRLVLVEGLNYPAVEEPLERGPTGNSPFILLVLNPRVGSLYGFSDTELQDKIQQARNRLRGQEEAAREAAQPRWAYNPAVINDPKVIKAIETAGPGEMVPVPVGTGDKLTDAIMPLQGNHEFNAIEFDDSKLSREQDKMAMMPEAALGVTGKADFAAEVTAATAGGNALARYRQTRINRAIKKLKDKCAQLILHNCPQDLAVRYAGPLASVFYPATPMERREVYDGLDIEVEIAIDKQIDSAKRMQALTQWADVMQKMGVKFDAETAGKIMGGFMGMGEDAKNLIQSDPNDLVSRLMKSLQDGKVQLTPEATVALAQVGQQAQQQVAQMISQQQAAQGDPIQAQAPTDQTNQTPMMGP